MSSGLIVSMPPSKPLRVRQESVYFESFPKNIFESDAINIDWAAHRVDFPTSRESLVKFQSLATKSRNVTRLVPAETTDEAKIFDAKVALKVATAHFAMHLSDEVRYRMFAEFDFLLEPEAWDPDDKLPSVESYKQFLKWVIYTRDNTWSSFGIGDEGNVLVAWVKGENIMTANFGARVKWTQKIVADEEPQLASGNFSLEHFARQAKTFLEV